MVYFFLAEQTSVHISDVSFNSATFLLTCGLEGTGTVKYRLQDDISSSQQSIEFSCGSSLTLDLMPGTNYTLIRQYGDQSCIIDGFTTPELGKSAIARACSSFEVIWPMGG